MSLYNKHYSNLDKEPFHLGKCIATVLVAGLSTLVGVGAFFEAGDILVTLIALFVLVLCGLAAIISQFWTKVHSLSAIEKVIVYAPYGIFWVTGVLLVVFLEMVGYAVKKELR
jgi:hypothetical protein